MAQINNVICKRVYLLIAVGSVSNGADITNEMNFVGLLLNRIKDTLLLLFKMGSRANFTSEVNFVASLLNRISCAK